jgi:hypothetical protein
MIRDILCVACTFLICYRFLTFIYNYFRFYPHQMAEVRTGYLKYTELTSIWSVLFVCQIFLFFFFKITMNYFFYSASLCWLTRIRPTPSLPLKKNKVVVTELLSWLAVCQSLYFIISLFLSPASRSDQLNSSPSRLQPLGWKSLPHCAEPCLWTSGLYRVILLNTFPDRADTTEIVIQLTQ